VDFVEIYNVCTRKVIIKAAKRIFNSDKICGSYCDFYFGVTFFGTHCIVAVGNPKLYKHGVIFRLSILNRVGFGEGLKPPF